jgi:hypothetical protein
VKIMQTCCHTVTLGQFFEIFRLSYGNIQISEKWHGKSMAASLDFAGAEFGPGWRKALALRPTLIHAETAQVRCAPARP